MPQIVESRPLAEATRPGAPSGRLRILAISPGIGSSGAYSEAVLKAAAEANRWPSGLHWYQDHATESEHYERPERSIRDLAAVSVTPGVWDDTEGGIVAEVQVMPAFREAIVDEAFLAATGVSISGSARISQGLYEGTAATLIDEITEIRSVDFVTHAGRGGRVLEILESARHRVDADPAAAQAAEAAAAATANPDPGPAPDGGDIPAAQPDPTPADPPQPGPDPAPVVTPAATETTTREALPGGLTGSGLRAAISNAVDATYDRRPDPTTSGGYVWSYLRDWTDTVVVFSLSGDGAPTHRLWAQTYTVGDDAVATLTGEATPVVVETRYLAVGQDGTPGAPVFTAVSTAEESATVRLPAGADVPAGDPAAALAEALRAPARPTPPSQPAGSTTESQREGTPVPDIEESRLRQLQEDAGRVQGLETERDRLREANAELVRRAQVAEARTYATTSARARVREANANLASGAVERIVADATRTIPLVESGALAGQLDIPALHAAVDAARTTEETYLADLLQESGAGSVRGVGSTHGAESDANSEKAVSEALDGLFGRTHTRA